MRDANRKNKTVRRSARAGFTLAELVVAIGAALLLTVGVGQIFQSVGAVVSQGSAVAEVDQLARSIEAQIRADFEGLNAMQADETFLAIRNRAITDVYLQSDDREADLREGADGTVLSRIIPQTRLDEIMFIATSDQQGGFPTYELNPIDPAATDPCEEVNDLPTSDHARIYYGHGLRPVEVPLDIEPTSNFPRLPDGDFGTAAMENNIYGTGSVTYDAVDGSMPTVPLTNVSDAERNRYAGEWPLARHAMLLGANGQGGGIMGNPTSGSPASNSLIGARREYAPFIRDHESEFRFDITDLDPAPTDGDDAFDAPTTGSGTFVEELAPHPRLMRHGRTDICAQSIDDVRRWLEGLEVFTPMGGGIIQIGPDASAWTGGVWDVYIDETNPPITTNSFNADERDAPLWERNGSATAFTTDMIEDNFRELQSAIAGCFFRPLVETETPVVQRTIDPTGAMTSTTTEDALMDVHALIASNCSRFEVAWSDGSRWDNALMVLDRNNFAGNFFRPDEEAVQVGDLIWFDINFTRRDLWQIADQYRINESAANVLRQLQDPEILPSTPVDQGGVPNARVPRTNWTVAESDERDNRLNLFSEADGNDVNPYDPVTTGGGFGEDEATDTDDTEYLAIFPFRELSTSGGDAGYTYGAPFAKPRFIRIRMTLHDSELRLENGKDFEFIVSVNPGGGLQ